MIAPIYRENPRAVRYEPANAGHRDTKQRRFWVQIFSAAFSLFLSFFFFSQEKQQDCQFLERPEFRETHVRQAVIILLFLGMSSISSRCREGKQLISMELTHSQHPVPAARLPRVGNLPHIVKGREARCTLHQMRSFSGHIMVHESHIQKQGDAYS